MPTIVTLDARSPRPDETAPPTEIRISDDEVLAMNPEVIDMDEPASALDPVATLRIEEPVQEPRDEVTIVIVTRPRHRLTQDDVEGWFG